MHAVRANWTTMYKERNYREKRDNVVPRIAGNPAFSEKGLTAYA